MKAKISGCIQVLPLVKLASGSNKYSRDYLNTVGLRPDKFDALLQNPYYRNTR